MFHNKNTSLKSVSSADDENVFLKAIFLSSIYLATQPTK